MEVGQIVYVFDGAETTKYNEEKIVTIKKNSVYTINANGSKGKFRVNPELVMDGVYAYESIDTYGSRFVETEREANQISEFRKIEYFDVNSFSKITSPKKPIKPSLKSTTPTDAEITEYQNAMNAYNRDLAVYANKHIEYGRAVHEWNACFIKYLITLNGLDKYPSDVHDTVYSAAYEHGHSSGYSEIASYYSEFAEMAIKIIMAVKP